MTSMKIKGISLAALFTVLIVATSAPQAAPALICPDDGAPAPAPASAPPASSSKPAYPSKAVYDDETAFVVSGEASGSVAFPTVGCGVVLVVPFTTTAGMNSYGRLVALTGNQKKFEMSVSTTPGNFAVPSLCYGKGSAGMDHIFYSPTGVYLEEAKTLACTVTPSQQYYYNLRRSPEDCANDSSPALFQTTRYVDLP